MKPVHPFPLLFCFLFFQSFLSLADEQVPYFDVSGLGCGPKPSRHDCSPGGVKIEGNPGPAYYFELDSSSPRGFTDFTEYGAYICWVSRDPEFLRGHLQFVFRQLQQGSHNPKCLHRLFQTVGEYRKLTSEFAFSEHIKWNPDRSSEWARVAEDTLKGMFPGGDGRGSWLVKSARRIGLGMPFHLIRTQSSASLVNGVIYSNFNRFELIDLKNWMDLQMAQSLVRDILTDSTHIDFAKALWRSPEVSKGNPSVHASWDALSLINDLYPHYGDSLFELWLRSSADVRAQGCSALRTFKGRLYLGDDNRSYCCWVKTPETDASEKTQCLPPRDRKVDQGGYRALCRGYSEGREFLGSNRILDDQSGESAESVQRYSFQSLQGFIGDRKGIVDPRGLQKLEELCR